MRVRCDLCFSGFIVAGLLKVWVVSGFTGVPVLRTLSFSVCVYKYIYIYLCVCVCARVGFRVLGLHFSRDYYHLLKPLK